MTIIGHVSMVDVSLLFTTLEYLLFFSMIGYFNFSFDRLLHL